MSGKKCDYRRSWAILYFLAWFLAAIPTLEGTPNLQSPTQPQQRLWRQLEDDMISIVVLRSAGTFIGIQVDQVLGEQEIVIKQFEGPAPKPVGVAGAIYWGW